ncbi:hypothetical protein ACWELO_05240 [Streptomyces sp. NPDC004596]
MVFALADVQAEDDVDNGGVQATGARSMAVGGNVGVAITGDGARVVMLLAEAVRWAREVEAPPGDRESARVRFRRVRRT